MIPKTSRVADAAPIVPGGPITQGDSEREATPEDRFIVAHMPHAARLARRHFNAGDGWADLFQEACLALVEVARHLAPLDDAAALEHAEALGTIWMRHRVALARAGERCGWSAAGHTLADWLKLNQARRRLRHELGREPTLGEVAQAAGIAPARQIALDTLAAPPVSLDGLTEVGHEAIAPAGDAVGAIDLALAVRQAVAALPEPERTVVARYFGIGQRRATVRALARELRMSPKRVIAVRRQGLETLRAMLGEE